MLRYLLGLFAAVLTTVAAISLWIVLSPANFSEPQICRAAIATHFLQRQLGQVQAVPNKMQHYIVASINGDEHHQLQCIQQQGRISLFEHNQLLVALFAKIDLNGLSIMAPLGNGFTRTRLFNQAQLKADHVRLAKYDLSTAIHEMYGEGYDSNQTIQQSVALLKACYICDQLQRIQQQALSPNQAPNAYLRLAENLSPYLINLVQRAPLDIDETHRMKQQIKGMKHSFAEIMPRLVSWMKDNPSANHLDYRLLQHQLSDLKRANPRLLLPDNCWQTYVHSAELSLTL